VAENKKTSTALSPDAEMAIFWRILHLLTARYGNHPMGQLLVALTMVFLNDRDRPPTMTELCRATGLPKASVSRYVSWQIKQGLAKEVIDPADRRQRRLVQTPKGRQESVWQSKQLSRLFEEITQAGNDLETRDGDTLLARLCELTENAPKRIE